MLVKGIHHVSLTCTSNEQYKETIKFYNEILGIQIWKEWDTGIMFKVGGVVVEVFFKDFEKDLPQGAVRHFAFATDNVDACIDAVRQAGYKITAEPYDVVIPTQEGYPVRVGFCIGPVGEEIEFFQER